MSMSNVIEVAKNVDVFVIPNHAGPVSDFLYGKDERKAYFEKVAEMNGLIYDPEEDLVQLWFVEMDEDWNHPEDENSRLCDNCVRHIWEINEYDTQIQEEYLPASWLGKEGDVISLKLPTIATRIGESRFKGEKFDMVIEANIRFNQSDYRYRSFGKFEEVVAKVCA